MPAISTHRQAQLAARERLAAARLQQARNVALAPAVRRQAGGGGALAAVVPGGWFGGWLGVLPWWQSVNPPGTGIEEAPMDGQAYVRVNGQWVPLSSVLGVTDGSEAQPGEMGEFISFNTQTAYQAAIGQALTTTLGALPAGDWDCWAFAGTSTALATLGFLMSPVPAGFSTDLSALLEDVSPEGMMVNSPVGRALTASASPIVFRLNIDSTQAGTVGLTFCARRRR